MKGMFSVSHFNNGEDYLILKNVLFCLKFPEDIVSQTQVEETLRRSGW